MTPKITIFLFLILLLWGAGCSVRPEERVGEGSATPAFTATLPVPSPLALTGTPSPLPAQPTTAPVSGTTSTQVNVRAEPSTASQVLGVIPPDTTVQITGRDPAGNWWQILYPQGPDGKGWVTAQYVTTADASGVPVASSTSGPDPGSGNVAVVQQQINVRSGPGTGFNSLGTLNARDVVSLTGKDANGAWLQIEFQAGPEGKGWINAAFVQATGVENLSIVTEAGELIGTGTPTAIPPTPTATVMPAWADNDSQDRPGASVIFHPLGTQALIYSGEVSAPDGDAEDWIQFSPYTNTVWVSLDCRGGNPLQARVLENGQPLARPLACGQSLKEMTVVAGSAYQVLLQASPSSGGLQNTGYTIKIQSSP